MTEIKSIDTLKTQLNAQIVTMITNDLTIGREDDDKLAYTPDQINNFIIDNNDKIKKVIDDIIEAYAADNDLHLLDPPLYDWVGEFLYEEINTDLE